MSASQTVCAPVVQQATTEMQARLDAGDTTTTNDSDEKHQSSIADKLHGLSEKIQQLGHIHQTEGGSGGDGGSRSRTGVANNYSTITLRCIIRVSFIFDLSGFGLSKKKTTSSTITLHIQVYHTCIIHFRPFWV